MVQFDWYYKSRAVGVTSEVGLLLTDVLSELSLCFSFYFYFCFSMLEKQGVFYTSVIPEVTWYKPLYNTKLHLICHKARSIGDPRVESRLVSTSTSHFLIITVPTQAIATTKTNKNKQTTKCYFHCKPPLRPFNQSINQSDDESFSLHTLHFV